MTMELSKGPGIRIDDSLTINCLLYADDIVVVANSASEMNLLLKYANKVAKNNNFEFNIKKCAYTGERDVCRVIVLWRSAWIHEIPLIYLIKLLFLYVIDNVILRIGNEKIGRTNTFTYLGVQFNYKGIDNVGHLDKLEEKLRKTIQFFVMLGMNKSGYKTITKILMYKSFIRSKMEYALAVFNISKKCQRIMDRIQYEALCRMFSVNKKSSTKTLELITGVLPVE